MAQFVERERRESSYFAGPREWALLVGTALRHAIGPFQKNFTRFPATSKCGEKGLPFIC